MFYQVKPNKIPNSRFSKISDLSFWYLFMIFSFIFLTINVTYQIFKNGRINNLYSFLTNNVANDILAYILLGGILGIFMASLGLTIYFILMFFKKLGISKFGVASTKIEFNFQDGSTVFNHYLSEIIYLFKRSKYRYIVFEDLDRFQNVEIFERLRSLNTTLNNSAQLRNRDIKFVYALKDDIFTNEDESDMIYNRTKFFDFIIPTIKVLHSSNAESEILRKLKGFWKEDSNSFSQNDQMINRQLIEDIALFINDMRTLINICNEFEVYRNRLRESSITYNNLFAFVVYKNIYPKDYSDLLENKGILYNVFNNKKEIESNLKCELKKLKNTSANGLGSIITDKKEIAMLFAKKRKLENRRIPADVNNPNAGEMLDFRGPNKNYIYLGEYAFNNLKKEFEGDISLFHGHNLVESFSSLEDFVTIEGVNYLELYRDFENQLIDEKEKIDQKISELERKVIHIKTKSISRLIKEDDIELNNELKDKRLLYFLIRNNWLNESYEDYITVFREGALSKKDNEFIQLIKLGSQESTLDYPLKNVRKVEEKIRVDEISSIAALNISLLKYLLDRLDKDIEVNKDKTSKIIEVLFEDLDENFDGFIQLLSGLKAADSIYVKKILEYSIQMGIDLWSNVDKLNIPEEQKMPYVKTLLEHVGPNYLEIIKSKNSLRDFISYNLDVAQLSDSENLYESIKRLGVKLNSLSGISKDVMIGIIKINAYTINLENMREIFNTKLISISIVETDSTVSDYCLENKFIFIKEVLVQQELYEEDEGVLIDFITNFLGDTDEEAAETEKQKYEILERLIDQWSGHVDNLEMVKSEDIVNILFEFKKFIFSWKNIDYALNLLTDYDNSELEFLLSVDSDWEEFIFNSSKKSSTKLCG